MADKSFLSAFKKAGEKRQGNDFSKMPRGNVTAEIIEIDTAHDKHKWLMKAKIVSGASGVGETINVKLIPRAVEWAEVGKLDQKIEEGSQVIFQALERPEKGSDIYTARRVVSWVLDPSQDEKKKRKVHNRVPFKINMFKSGAYQMVMALPDSKAKIADVDELQARIAEDIKSGLQTMIVGRVGAKPFYIEAINGHFDRDQGKYVTYDAAGVTENVIERINSITSDQIKEAEEDGADLNIEMNAYSLKSMFLGGSTRDMLIERMSEKGNFSQIPVEMMFPRPVIDHLKSGLASVKNDAKKVKDAVNDWVESNLDKAAREEWKKNGYDGLSPSDLVKALESLNIQTPHYSSTQTTSWQKAVETLKEDDKRNRISTGWVIGDIVTQGLVDKKTKKIIFEYPTKANIYSTTKSAAPFFPDGEYLNDRNDEFFKSIREGLVAYVGGGVAKKADKKESVAELHDDTDKPSNEDVSKEIAGELEDMLGDDFDLDTEAHGASDDIGNDL